MTEKVIETAPTGFELLPQGLGYTDTLQPVYRKVEGDSAIFGLVVENLYNFVGIANFHTIFS